MEDFRKQEAIRYWGDTLATRKESTRTRYVRDFRLFCEWLGKTPDKIMTQRKEDLKSEDEKIKHRYELQLKKYIAHLNKEGLSVSTQRSRYAAVRSFFDSHYIPLKLRRTDAPSGEPIGSRIPEKIEIRKMMNLAPDLKWRALISFLKDSGWRIGDVRKLTWGDIKEIEPDFWNFNKATEKRKIKAIGFVGPETTELLRLYRKQRIERGEEIEEDSLLFPSRLGDFLTVGAISTRISDLAEMAGAEDVTAHSLRKFFRANLEPHIPNTWLKTMLGKKIGGSTAPYTEKRPKKLLEAYKRSYNALRLIEIPSQELQVQQALTSLTISKPGLTEEQLAQIERILRRKVSIRPITAKVIRETLEALEESEEAKNCSNGNCQRIVTEEELGGYLKTGWRVSAVLPSGKVVIDNNHH